MWMVHAAKAHIPYEKAPPSRVGLRVGLHIKEVFLLNFLVVMHVPVPPALVHPLPVLGRLSLVLRRTASQQQQQKYSFHNR